MASPTAKSYPSTAFILSLIGGLFIILAGAISAWIYAVGAAILFAFFPGGAALLIGLAVAALLFGVIIIVGAFMLRSKPESSKTWGIIILLLALFSWVGGGGFFIGFILALIGGILAITWHPPASPQAAWGQPTAAPPMNPPAWGGQQPPATPPQ